MVGAESCTFIVVYLGVKPSYYCYTSDRPGVMLTYEAMVPFLSCHLFRLGLGVKVELSGLAAWHRWP